MAKITGIGGVFIQSTKDSKALSQWYAEHLGLKLEEYGHAALEWRDDTAEDGGLTVWCTAAPDSDWFAPSQASFMINYRIDDMDGMLAQLEAGGVEIVKGPESHENGRFLWVMDPEGNKIELWEPKLWDEKNKEG
ncbi:MAG: VOC family protein [Pseudomonadota bacterium]